MARQTILLCDVCGSDQGVGRYRVGRERDGRKSLLTAELCEAHGGALDTIIDAIEAQRKTSARYRTDAVVTLDQIKAAKTPAARAPRKSAKPPQK